MQTIKKNAWAVTDLFSGGGGMSYGFHIHPRFELIGAVDAQKGKPSNGEGSLECNATYKANIGIEPIEADLSSAKPADIYRKISKKLAGRNLAVLISCAPCTGFSRVLSKNHLKDNSSNSLVSRSALFVQEFNPDIFIMENARELLMGRFSHHFDKLKKALLRMNYDVHAKVHFLDKFGLPQRRERTLVIAVRSGLTLHTLDELWEGYKIKAEATHVRSAIGSLPKVRAGESFLADPLHVCPQFHSPHTIRRLELMKKDGGSWTDLVDHPEANSILTPAMKRYVSKGDFGSHPDVYGRLWWDRPAVTIKRECGHVGNGRYSHPIQNRLCTIREMAILQGFPKHYKFEGNSLTNKYRHIGDAVPPLIAFQIAKVCEWILSGKKPNIHEIIMPDSHLTADDIISVKQQKLQFT